MKLAVRWLGQQQWETAPEQNAVEAKQAALTWLEQAAQAFVRRLMADAEPRVWQTIDANGKRWWNAHDPMRGRSLYSVSEAEMRVWIEQRHDPTEG